MEFNLTDIYSTYLNDSSELVEDLNADLNQLLDELTDKLAVSPEVMEEEEVFNKAVYLQNSYGDLDTKSRETLLDLVLSGLKEYVKNAHAGLDQSDSSALVALKPTLERYAFLLHWNLNNLDAVVRANAASANPGTGGRPKVPKAITEVSQQLLIALDTICACLRLNLATILPTSSELDTFTALFLRPIFQLMESEILLKNTSVRMHMFKAVSLTVKNHNQQMAVQTSLTQLLIYFEHFPEYLAELLHILYTQYDHLVIMDEILKELSNRDFNANDTKGPKFVSLFLIKLSQLAPMPLVKQMTVLVRLLDTESFTLRCAVVESTGNIIMAIAKHVIEQGEGQDDPERQMAQIHSLMDLIDERVLDVNPYCRVKALQVMTSVCELEAKFTTRRPFMTKAAVNCLRDRSSLVRRNAIKLLNRLVSTHPFGLLHGSQLKLSDWQERLEQVNEELKAALPNRPPAQSENGDESVLINGAELDAPSDDENDDNGDRRKSSASRKSMGENPEIDEELVDRLKLTKKYYTEAIAFIEAIHDGIKEVEKLLFSKAKNEIIESMDFFVLADAYGVTPATVGIRKMIHLIWAKANNDEGQAIQTHLIDCYRNLFFEPPIGMADNDADLLIARNLISLTYGATLAELASLEYLLILAMDKQQLISTGVVKMLWKIYGYQQKEISKSQRRGAVIILGMISKADSSIAKSGLDLLLKIGLGERGRADLGLAKYTCIALQNCVSEKDWKKVRPHGGPPERMAPESEAIRKLGTFLLSSYQNMEWFGVAEQAIKAINDLCESPDVVFSELIRVKAREVFEGTGGETALSQLLFILGEVALKIMVHLERCEALFKRSKIELEKAKAAHKDAQKEEGDDLEMVGGGTSEDDFSEAISYVREKELLYGERSLLARFGEMVSEICKAGLRQRHSEHLSIASTLCLAKFMCVSGKFMLMVLGGMKTNCRNLLRRQFVYHYDSVGAVRQLYHSKQLRHCSGRYCSVLQQYSRREHRLFVPPIARQVRNGAANLPNDLDILDSGRPGKGQGSVRRNGKVLGGSRPTNCRFGTHVLYRVGHKGQCHLQFVY